MSRRTLRVRAPPELIRRRDRIRYDGFPDVPQCWQQSETHRRYFLGELNCPHINEYHSQRFACGAFDDLVGRIAGEDYKYSFFNYYRIPGPDVREDRYLQGLTRPEHFNTLLNRVILRKEVGQIRGGIPGPFENWPQTFDLALVIAIENRDEWRLVLDMIETCIERRLIFRNACVRTCNRRIQTDGHDKFILILQILRARIIRLQLA